MSIEETLKIVDFQKCNNLVPVIVQDHKSKEVLMLGFFNKECLKKSLNEGIMIYWSRTRKKEWKKGETSGNYQIIKEVFLDCDNDTFLIRVKQIGNVCHTGNKTCFFKKVNYEK